MSDLAALLFCLAAFAVVAISLCGWALYLTRRISHADDYLGDQIRGDER